MKAMEDECDMTVYIEEFEYLMEKTEVEEDEWANYLRPLLNSKARSAIAVLDIDIEERDEYELLKETILDQEDAVRKGTECPGVCGNYMKSSSHSPRSYSKGRQCGP